MINKTEIVNGQEVQSYGLVDKTDTAPGVADATYRHEQISPSASWAIVHNLGKEPVIQVFDSTGREVKGTTTHDSLYQSTVNFKSQFAGHANCS